MRGTLLDVFKHPLLDRIIPAYAGNTRQGDLNPRLQADHPRVCGEHHRSTSNPAPTAGSSPRMRGTQSRRSRNEHRPRIIPAYAGNTPAAYPLLIGGIGSSPRMRGTLATSAAAVAKARIIPAYAGNTAFICTPLKLMTDHPRVCGEHIKLRVLIPRNVGSSPRMRGTRRRISLPCERNRIIPAYAGNTPCGPLKGTRLSDHPRVCGEHVVPGQIIAQRLGSSPRMRGTHDPVYGY